MSALSPKKDMVQHAPCQCGKTAPLCHVIELDGATSPLRLFEQAGNVGALHKAEMCGHTQCRGRFVPLIFRGEHAARKRDLLVRHQGVGNTVQWVVDAIDLFFIGLTCRRQRPGCGWPA
jgi:hypothetical protein